MTTWQDQQPRSRRALRERERAHATLQDVQGEEVSDPADHQKIWTETPGPPIRESQPVATQVPPALEEPLRRPRRSEFPRPMADPAAAEPSPPASESPAYRVRDFSPETRRGSTFSSTQSEAWVPQSSGSDDLRYKTSVGDNRPVSDRYSPPAPLPPVAVAPESATAVPESTPPAADGPRAAGDVVEHTLTRRELREIRHAAAAKDPELATPITAPPVEPERTLTPPPIPPSAPTMPPHHVPPMPTAAAQTPPHLPPMPASAPSTAAAPEQPAQKEEPNFAMAEFDPVFDDEREVVAAPEVQSVPLGHWSAQAAAGETSGSVGRPHTRDLASSDAITTSALILPSFPVSPPVTGPVSGTGQTLMTGSISLPRSLGVTGLHPARYDRPDIDDLIDAADRENGAPDSAPVRAVRAVSTYTSSQGIINAKRPKGNNLPMVLSITAEVMMVGVVVLVVVGMVFKIF